MAAVPQLRLPPLPTIRDIIRLYQLRALKELSQNFLMDPRLVNKIAKAAGKIKGGQVCEVGPGPGGITRSLLNRGPKKMILIEKDKRFVPALELLSDAVKGICETDIIIDDVLNFDMSKTFDEESSRNWSARPPNIHLIGNLPFNISTPLIVQWLKAISLRNNAWSYGRVRMTLTFQKEVAERLAAPILHAQRCRLSVMAQNWCHVEHKFTISGKAFLPKPDVDVGVVHFVPRIEPIIPMEFHLVERVLRHIFSFRQKFSLKGVQRLFPLQQREELGYEMFQKADLNPHTRSFQVTIEEYGRLCQAYKEICDREPRLYNYDHRANKLDREKRWDLFEDEESDNEEVNVQTEVQ